VLPENNKNPGYEIIDCSGYSGVFLEIRLIK